MDEFDEHKSKAARDEGMDRALTNEPVFADLFHEFVLHLPHGWVGQCEDIRRAWLHPAPRSPNAWGACWHVAIRRGLLHETDIEASMTAVRSHGRKTHLYRRGPP